MFNLIQKQLLAIYHSVLTRPILIIMLVLSEIHGILLINSPKVLTYDSHQYLGIATQLQQLTKPDLSIRSPLYPSYLAFFSPNHLEFATLGQYLMLLLSAVLLFLILYQISHRLWLSCIITIIANLSLQVVQYQSLILTEAMAIFIITAYIWGHLLLLRQPLSIKTILFRFIFDAALILIKPNFIFLPFAWYFVLALSAIWQQNPLRWQTVKPIVARLFIQIGLVIALLLAWSGYNYHHSQIFGISTVSDINLFGKMVQYGYINSDAKYHHPPQVVTTYITEYAKVAPQPDAWYVMHQVQADGLYSLAQVRQVNLYMLEQHPYQFIIQSFNLLPLFFTETKIYAEYPPQIMHLNISDWVQIYQQITRQGEWAVPLSLIVTLWLIAKNRYQPPYALVLINLVIIVTALTSVFFSYNEYARMRTPIEPLLISLILLLPSWIFLELVTLPRIKHYYQPMTAKLVTLRHPFQQPNHTH